jgi:hypothetical protein
MTDNSSTKAPTIDPKAWQRNKTTACLEFVDRLSSWLWQDNEGAARWTLVLDDTERHGSTTPPPRTAAGLKSQVLHQSRLKHALVTAFGSIYKTIINAHPNIWFANIERRNISPGVDSKQLQT